MSLCLHLFYVFVGAKVVVALWFLESHEHSCFDVFEYVDWEISWYSILDSLEHFLVLNIVLE